MNGDSTKWYYLKGGSWLGPIEDEEKNELLNIGVYPRYEEDYFDDFDVRIYRARSRKYGWYDDEIEDEFIEIVDNRVEKNRKYAAYEVGETKEERVNKIDDNVEEENDEKNRINIDWEEEKEVEKQKDSKSIDALAKGYQDDDEDVLAVTNDDLEYWNPEDFTNIENSDEEFDDLAVLDSEPDDKAGDDGSVLDDEETYDDSEFDDEDLDTWDESDSSNEQDVDLALRFNDQAERLKTLEEGFAQIRRKLDALEETGKSRSDYFEEKTDVFGKTYADLSDDVQTLAAKFDAYNVNEWKVCLDVQDERLRSVEGNLERIGRRVDKIFQDSASRSDALEKKTDVLSKTCGKFDSDLQNLSVRVSAFDTNAWNVRLDDQAEDMAIIRERITGIEHRVNGTAEKNDRRIGDLEEKVGKYEFINSDVVAKVNAFETTIQSLENSVRGWNSISSQVNLLQRKQETLVAETKGLPSLKKSVGNLESRFQAFQTRFDSFEREVNNADLIYESRFMRLEKPSNSSASNDSLISSDASSKIQYLLHTVERINSSLTSLSNLEKIVANLQNEPCPTEARVKNLEAVSEEFKSSIEGQRQFFLEQTRNLSLSIRSHASNLTEQIEQTQAKVQRLDACVRRLEEESTGTAFMSRMNQLLTKFQEQNKEQKEENRRFQAYVDEQRQAMEKLVKELEQKTASLINQETYMGDKKTNENLSKQSRGFWGNIFGGGRAPNEEKN